MATQQDCAAIEQANAQMQQRREELDDQIQDQQNLLNGLFSNDPQRLDVQKSVANLSRQRDDLLADIHKGEQALKDCQQESQKA